MFYHSPLMPRGGKQQCGVLLTICESKRNSERRPKGAVAVLWMTRGCWTTTSARCGRSSRA